MPSTARFAQGGKLGIRRGERALRNSPKSNCLGAIFHELREVSGKRSQPGPESRR